jgi:ATP/maltotriose-dependent transcriptional regulator MalT
VDPQTSGESKQPHWALPPHPWIGPELAASAILQLGTVRRILTGTSPRHVRRILRRAWQMMLNLEIREALSLVDTVEPSLAELEPTTSDSLRVEVDLLRAAGRALRDDSAGALAIASLILRHSGAQPASIQQSAATICRWAYWKAADLESFHSLTRSDPGAAVDKRRALTTTIDLSIEAAVEFEQLRLGTALRLARDATTLAEKFLGPGSTLAVLPASVVARVLYEGGYFVEAENLLRERLGDISARGTIETALRTYPVLARIAMRKMQPDTAYELLAQAESLGERRGWLRLRAASLTEQVHLLLAEGRHEGAIAVVKRLDEVSSQACSTHCPAATSIQRYQMIARSRLESARGPSVSAVAALRQVHHDAVRRRDFYLALQTVLWIIEGLLSLGEQQEALSLFDGILEVGGALGLYEMFIDCGSRVAQLLPSAYERAGTRGNSRAALLPYIGSLLSRWQTYEAARPQAMPSMRPPGPLSQREQHVLKLIGSGLSNKQIAQALAIAPETVKSHAKNIFMKLDVKTRTEAAVRAQQRGILL